MGKDLTSMIEEINDTSSSLNKNNKPDDPVSLQLDLKLRVEADSLSSSLKSFAFSTVISLSFSKSTKVRLHCN